jgi:2-polyprenyl-6-methoxyphenol hydroxylase-like FAD-dependent oxidoreductase
MTRIVVAGAGVCGMAAAMMLARDGHDVTVLDRDDAPVPSGPDEAWSSWARRGVAQFRLPHLLLPGGFHVLVEHLPEVAERLAAAGGYRWNPVEELLPAVPGSAPRDDDDRFASITARRPALEWAFAATLAEEPRVDVRRGCPLDGFVTGADVIDGVPHVVGVRLTDGEEIGGDLVVDATGRRSATCAWLAAIGSRPPEETSEDLGFTYTGRFWRSSDGSLPETRAPGLTPCGSVSLLTIPSDNGTWSTTIFTASDDKALRATRDPEVFERVWARFPDHAHWLDGEPISDMVMMSGTVDRTRRFVVDGTPVVTGVATIADAHSCTNPSIGRGITIGLKHTVVMRDAVARHLADPAELALAFDAATSAEIHPWHEATAVIDRQRMPEIRAAIDGEPLEPSPDAAIADGFARATMLDEDVLRWYVEVLGCLALPMEVMSRPGVFERVLELAGNLPAPTPYGPSRAELLDLVG